MRLMLVTASLSAGGAERVAATLANRWVEDGHQVTIVTLRGPDHQPFYQIDDRATLIKLGTARPSAGSVAAALSARSRSAEIRRALKQVRPDVAVSFMDSPNILTVAAARRLGIPVIVTEHCSPQVSAGNGLWNAARRWSYRNANLLVVPTQAAAQYHRLRGLSQVSHIPNPLLPPDTSGDPCFAVPRPAVIAMGRFVPVKGFDLLIRAFARTRDAFPGWSLVILGDGPMRGELERLREDLVPDGAVHLPGVLKSPGPVLAAGDIFVFSSRIESFGMALCEAMSCGLPVISTNCPVGPAEIIRDGIDGILTPVDDEYALAQAMLELMGDDQKRAMLASNAANITGRYGIERVAALWDAAFQQISGRAG